MRFFSKIAIKIVMGLIIAYRYSFSALLGRQCRFQPTCSAYALEALERFGLWRGGWLALKRIGACHPFTCLGARDGYDPVPQDSGLQDWRKRL